MGRPFVFVYSSSIQKQYNAFPVGPLSCGNTSNASSVSVYFSFATAKKIESLKILIILEENNLLIMLVQFCSYGYSKLHTHRLISLHGGLPFRHGFNYP